MKDIGELLSAIGSLLWPIFAFTVFIAYKNEFRTLLRRLRRGKLLGQEVELEESLVALEASAKQAIIEVAASPNEVMPQQAQVPSAAQDDEVAKIIQLAAQSPKAALLVLAADIERELRVLLVNTGWHGGRRIVGLKQGFDMLLRETEALPPHVGGSVRLFADMRSRLVHGASATDDDVLRALDSGLTILKALRAIPQEHHVVQHANVQVFRDPGLTQPLSDVRAVILESISPGGATKRRDVFPTTKQHFQKGKAVAWEWNSGTSFGIAWYRDPDSGQVTQAWGGALEFVGRHLDDLHQ